MKLHPTLKDPEMKYPRLANALLDVGMVLSILSSVGLIFATIFYWGVGQYMPSGMLVLIVGVLLVACAAQVSKVRRQTIDEGRPTLRRVK